MAQRKRILMISPAFPPAADSESFCAGKMAFALKNAGHEVEVIYSSNYRGGIRRDGSKMWKEFSLLSHDVPVPSPSGSRMESLACALRFGTLFFTRWIRDVVQLAEGLHAARPFDVVQSRSLPMIAHIAGYHASRQLGIPWNANLNDPWDFHLFPDGMPHSMGRLERTISSHWLRKTLRSADLVTYCSAQLRDYHLSLTCLPHKSAIVPHIGWSISPENGGKTRRGLHLVHAGKLGANEFTGRSTRTLLHGIAAFIQKCQPKHSEFSLTLVGPEDIETAGLVRALRLEKFVRNIGPVSYEESLHWIAGSSVCVLVEARMAEGIFFPSKCADYIAAGKPILAFSPRKGVVADLAVLGNGITRIDGEDSTGVAAALEDFYFAQQQGSLSRFAPDEALRSLCSPEHVTETFLEALKTCSEKKAAELHLWEKTFTQAPLEIHSAQK
jgi:hypothetical protein